MDGVEGYVPYTQQLSSFPPPHPQAVVPTGYSPITAPLQNTYASGPYLSSPSHYPFEISYALPSSTSTLFRPQTFHDDVPLQSLNSLQSALDKVKRLSEMADPLSVVASIVAIAAAAVHVSQTLYKLADTLGGTNSELESIALEVETFSSVLEDLRDVLDDAEDLITPKALKHANTILSKCKGIFETIQQWLAPYKDVHRLNFWHNVQWTFRRERVKPMRCRLETLKTTLLVWLGTVKLARYRIKLIVVTPDSDKKDRRYLANVEKSIFKNDLAIVRWERAEAESNQLNYRYGLPDPRITQGSIQSSKEIQWISHLIPYTKSPQAEPWRQLLRQDSLRHDSNSPKSDAAVEVSKTVDLLLTKWTTLKVSSEDRSSTQETKGSSERSREKLRRATSRGSLDQKLEHFDVKETEDDEEQHQTERSVESNQASRGSIEIDRDHSNEKPGHATSVHSSRSAEGDRIASVRQDAAKAYINGTLKRRQQGSPSLVHRSAHDHRQVAPPIMPAAQTGYAQTLEEPSSFADQNLPYAPIATSENPYVPLPLSYPYPNTSPYGMPTAAPPFTGRAVPTKTTQPRAEGDDSREDIMERVEEMLVKQKKERLAQGAAEEAQIAATKAESERQAGLRKVIVETVKEVQVAMNEAESKREAAFRGMMARAAQVGTKIEGVAAAAAARAQEEAGADNATSENATIEFKVSDGIKFIFPLKLCRTWDGMEELIRQSLLHFKDLEPQIANGRFDLLDPRGDIILPGVWESVIEPGWTVTIQIWPLPDEVNVTKNEPTATVLAPGAGGPRVKVPMPPHAVVEDESEAESTSSRWRFKQRSGKLHRSGEPKSNEDSDSDDSESTDALDSEAEEVESVAMPWQAALGKSSVKFAKEFQRTWDSIMVASRAEAEREILRIWLKESSAQRDEGGAHQKSQELVGDSTADPKIGDKYTPGELERQVSPPTLGSNSSNSNALKSMQPPLAPNDRIDSHCGMPGIQEAGLLSAAEDRICRDCQSPLPFREQPRNRPNDLMQQPMPSPRSPMQGPSTAQELLPRFDIDGSSAVQNRGITQRLEVLEKLFQQREAKNQAQEKAAIDEERLARLEAVLLPQDGQKAPLTTPSEPGSSEFHRFLKTSANRGSKREDRSGRGSFRARLLGRAPSSSTK